MDDQPNPDYVNAPFSVSGWVNDFLFIAQAAEPAPPEEEILWIKLPERQPMHYKNGKWVPWLNAPTGWEGFVPSPEYRGELPGEGLDGKPMRFV